MSPEPIGTEGPAKNAGQPLGSPLGGRDHGVSGGPERRLEGGPPHGVDATFARQPGDRVWPIFITVGLVLVVLVNALFIYIAVSGADDVVPSYHTEER